MQQLLALMVLCLLTPVTVAQNLVATPLYGTARLTAGFTDDPYPVEVLAGGQVEHRATFDGGLSHLSKIKINELRWDIHVS